jgi:hypothetical protein
VCLPVCSMCLNHYKETAYIVTWTWVTDNSAHFPSLVKLTFTNRRMDRLCGLVVRVLGYRSGGPGSIPGTTRKKNVVGLERGPLSLVSTS